MEIYTAVYEVSDPLPMHEHATRSADSVGGVNDVDLTRNEAYGLIQ